METERVARRALLDFRGTDDHVESLAQRLPEQ